jgi:aldose 1-epimerase
MQNNNSGLKYFGKLSTGEEVTSYTLRNNNGMELTVLNYGAIITSLQVPVGDGTLDVVLGFDALENYIASHALPAPPYFGAVIGRYSGRIKNGRFSLGGEEFRLNLNNGANTLHGGNKGFDKVLWEVRSHASETSLTLGYISKSGEENFPGEMDIEVNYTLSENNEVIISYKATTTEDTIINITQHSYFNLDGHKGNVLDQELTVNSDTILDILPDNIPTGKLIKAADKGFDFTQSRICPSKIDDTFVIQDDTKPAAVLQSAGTGLKMTVYSDQPALHIYVGGNCFGRVKGKGGVAYHAHSGICFESQNYPDAPNHPHFPDVTLRKGETYTQKTIWGFESI